jgi:hypothetical protein
MFESVCIFIPCPRLGISNPPLIIVCREAVPAIKVLHAVIEMVETVVRSAHRSCLSGESFKPPKGALVKSHGIERLGKGFAVSEIR